ncbi:hypothetical protein ACFPRL_09845 [Pseudoclavibacter helvolus]
MHIERQSDRLASGYPGADPADGLRPLASTKRPSNLRSASSGEL